MKTLIYTLFKSYWEETTVQINDKEVIELGGFIICLFIVIGSLFLFDYFGFISVFQNYRLALATNYTNMLTIKGYIALVLIILQLVVFAWWVKKYDKTKKP